MPTIEVKRTGSGGGDLFKFAPTTRRIDEKKDYILYVKLSGHSTPIPMHPRDYLYVEIPGSDDESKLYEISISLDENFDYAYEVVGADGTSEDVSYKINPRNSMFNLYFQRTEAETDPFKFKIKGKRKKA